MRLTVLGAYGSFPGADGACSGFLVEAEGLQLLLDCGSGVLGRLQRYRRVEELDAIVVSHLHFDHMADLLVLQYALGIRKQRAECFEPLPLHLPATPEGVAKLLEYEDVYARTYIQDGMLVQLGPLGVSFARMEHSVESYAVTVKDGGKKLVYSGDTACNARLLDVAHDADLFLCEATGLRGGPTTGEAFPHLTARQAAEVARQAGVRQLLLTHRWFELPEEEYLAEARAVLASTELAREFVTYDV